MQWIHGDKISVSLRMKTITDTEVWMDPTYVGQGGSKRVLCEIAPVWIALEKGSSGYDSGSSPQNE